MPGYTYVAVNEKGKEKRGRMICTQNSGHIFIS